MNNNEFPAEKKSEIEALVKEAVQKAKDAAQQKKDKIKADTDALSPEMRESLQHMKVYKFYPSNWLGATV